MLLNDGAARASQARAYAGAFSPPRAVRLHLNQRYAEGFTLARRLFEEIRQCGFPGQEQIVRVWVRQPREAFPHQDPPRLKPSARDVIGWITHHPEKLTDDALQLKEILARAPVRARTAEHVRTFAELMNDRRGHQLKDWIARIQQDQDPALQRFATGLLQDLDAVVAGLTLRYSSGAVEGHRLRSRSKLARPNIRRLIILILLYVLHTA